MILLDTHVLLWVLDDSPRLGPHARHLVSGAPAHVSAASLWEVAIKSGLGKLSVPEDLPSLIEASGLEWLPVHPAHVWPVRGATGLPHRDPFDTLLVTQARLEGASLLTADDVILGAAPTLGVDLIDARR